MSKAIRSVEDGEKRLEELLSGVELGSLEEWNRLRESLLSAVDREVSRRYGDGETFSIAADEVALDVTDRESGRVYHRTLPLGFRESDNALRLLGENADGRPAEIVFLSGTALERIRDLTGQGPDKPRCKD